MKLAKTIRFDKSDLNVFENSSDEGEWAVSGAFEFSEDTNTSLNNKRRQAFSNGFLGLATYGRATLVSVSQLTLNDKDSLISNLSEFFVDKYGAPNIKAAKPVAEEEIDFMINLCAEHEIGTLLTVNRTLENDGIHEKFRHLPKNDACSNQQIWATVVDD